MIGPKSTNRSGSVGAINRYTERVDYGERSEQVLEYKDTGHGISFIGSMKSDTPTTNIAASPHSVSTEAHKRVAKINKKIQNLMSGKGGAKKSAASKKIVGKSKAASYAKTKIPRKYKDESASLWNSPYLSGITKPLEAAWGKMSAPARSMVIGGGLGAGAGYVAGDKEERGKTAAMGGALGAGAGYLAGKHGPGYFNKFLKQSMDKMLG